MKAIKYIMVDQKVSLIFNGKDKIPLIGYQKHRDIIVLKLSPIPWYNLIGLVMETLNDRFTWADG